MSELQTVEQIEAEQCRLYDERCEAQRKLSRANYVFEYVDTLDNAIKKVLGTRNGELLDNELKSILRFLLNNNERLTAKVPEVQTPMAQTKPE